MEGASSLESDSVLAAGTQDALPDAETARDPTATAVVDLLSLLQSTLVLLDSRAMNLTALLLASLIGLWTQLHAFSATAAAILAWSAWIVLVLAVLVMARVMLPHRLVRLGDAVLGSTTVPGRFGPEEEAQVLAGASVAVRDEITWLRKHLLIAIVLSVFALVEVVVAYVVQKT